MAKISHYLETRVILDLSVKEAEVLENILIRPCILANKKDREIERKILDKLSITLREEGL